MTRKSPTLDEEGLAQRVAAAFERLPQPESARLGVLEDRIMRALPTRRRGRRAPVWYWWLIGALAVSGAAAWWTGKYFDDASPDAALDEPGPSLSEPSRQEIDDARRGGEQVSPGAESSTETGKSRGIYRRERY